MARDETLQNKLLVGIILSLTDYDDTEVLQGLGCKTKFQLR